MKYAIHIVPNSMKIKVVIACKSNVYDHAAIVNHLMV